MNVQKIIGNKRESERVMLDHLKIFVDEECTAEDNPGIHSNTFQKIKDLRTDEIYCPKCKLESRNNQVSLAETQASFQWESNTKKRYLERYSMFGGRSFLGKGFKGFDTNGKAEVDVKKQAMDISKRIAEGKIMNCLLTGRPGTGKSHISYSMLFNINEMSAEYKKQLSCVFVDFTTVLQLIKASYSNGADDKKTADYYLNLMKNADVLCIDDLGTSEGSVDADGQASRHTYEILFQILDAREGTKSTIITTNLTYKQLKAVYDDRIVSRLSTNLNILDFALINDKRPGFGF